MDLQLLKSGTRVLILEQNCEKEDEFCSNDIPCDDCLKGGHIVIIESDVKIRNIGGIEYLRNTNSLFNRVGPMMEQFLLNNNMTRVDLE